MDVYYFFFTNQTDVILEHTLLLDILLSYSNVYIRSVSIAELTKGTVLEQFFQNNSISDSYRLEHTSDILRILVLNKFGGLYLDLDVISSFPVRLMNRKNFICLEDQNKFNNAIVKLDRVEGKKFSDAYLK
jgi:lactosylceramide 4-alpha-galactosyltransferase